MFRNFKLFVALMLVFVLVGSSYAFAAANVIPQNEGAGQGDETVTGYTITSVVYDLDTADPTGVDAITFDILPTVVGTDYAEDVYIQADSSGGEWVKCVITPGLRDGVDPDGAVCTFAALLAADIDTLNIVATSSSQP